jgi:hypothetical protein
MPGKDDKKKNSNNQKNNQQNQKGSPVGFNDTNKGSHDKGGKKK